MTLRRDPQMLSRIRTRLSDRLVQAGESVRDRAVSLMDEPKGGVHYPGSERPSSKPGEPPARQSGELAESIAVSEPITTADGVEVHVYSPLPRARWLEAGTIDREPRPFLLPALVESERQVLKAVGGEGVPDV